MRQLDFRVLALLTTVLTGCAMADVVAAAGMVPGMARSSGASHDAVVTPVRHASQLGADIWVEDHDDVFSPGERVRVRFRTSESAYAAVIHIDTDGRIELLYPYDLWEDGFIRGGRDYLLSTSGLNRYWGVSGTEGIGYLYLIASPEPLDLRFFQRGGREWQGFGWERTVRGDPFWAMQNIAQILVPEWGYVPYVEDVYTYYVGRRHRYPRYACYDGVYSDWGGSYYASCDRIQLLLDRYPGYYDSRRYRGDRSGYLRELDRGQPVHGYKERADLPQRAYPLPGDRIGTTDSPRPRPDVPAVPRVEREEPRKAEPRDEGTARPAVPERQRPRPKLERRPPERTPAQPARPPRSRTPERRAEPRQQRDNDQSPPSRPARPVVRRPGG